METTLATPPPPAQPPDRFTPIRCSRLASKAHIARRVRAATNARRIARFAVEILDQKTEAFSAALIDYSARSHDHDRRSRAAKAYPPVLPDFRPRHVEEGLTMLLSRLGDRGQPRLPGF